MSDNEDHYIVPATPGWSVAVYIAPGKDYDGYLSLHPIIAWEIQREEGPCDPRAGGQPGQRYLSHSVMPLTVDGNMNNHGNLWAIKRPDGTYEIPGDCCFETEADMIEELRERSRVRPRAEA